VPPIPAEFASRIRLPAYLIVAFLSLGSIVEVLVGSWPLHVHDMNWRLAVLNSAAGAAGTELLALLILILVAQIAMSAAGLWAGVWFSLLVALAYAGGAVTFALDSLQLRARIPADQLSRFDVTVGWALARFGITALICLTLAACALAAARRRVAARDTANRLIVGTPAAPPPARVDA
jgi:hypothetical protein